MAILSYGIFVIKQALGLDKSGRYNRLALISVDVISGVY